MGQNCERMTDGARTQTESEITDLVVEPPKQTWIELRRFLEEPYNLMPEIVSDGPTCTDSSLPQKWQKSAHLHRRKV